MEEGDQKWNFEFWDEKIDLKSLVKMEIDRSCNEEIVWKKVEKYSVQLSNGSCDTFYHKRK